ncbi:interleukin-1 receptor type 2 [Hippocampus comes]|uniref:interleukin-1 receptor type 2 n=1 Tax=Hippocampus comes TaxID=109280 RepID=UPI00094EEF1D|nr:PREDICTED: interleukin-1 receptor type 2 [Hippocampus comes]
MSAILALMMLAVELAHGWRFPLPPMLVKDGCFVVAAELDLFRLEGEAVTVSFPYFRKALKVRRIEPPDASLRISKGNRTHDAGEGRVRLLGPELWLLPAWRSDSGEYTCTFRNATYCIQGSVTLRVYAALAVGVDNLSYEYNATLGENVTLRCPVKKRLSHTRVQWYKEDSSAIGLQAHRRRSLRGDAGKLRIPEAQYSDSGLYTCRLSVLVDRSEFPLTRTFRLLVKEPELPTALTPPPPLIITPLNGSVHEASHGSELEVKCTALTACESERQMAVWWSADGVQVDASRLNGRVLQGVRRESRVESGCLVEVSLLVAAMTEQEEGAELTCVAQNQDGRREVTITLHVEDSSMTWLVVACVSTSCFLAVLSVFLYVLLIKPKLKKKTKKNANYFLARQDSAF